MKVKITNKKKIVKLKPYDTYSMDMTLAIIILPMLKQLKKNKKGAPWVDSEDVPKELHTESPDNPLWFKKWEFIMDEMIYAFKTHLSDWDLVELPDGSYTSISNKKRKKIQERLDNGFRLFGKYYQNLWS